MKKELLAKAPRRQAVAIQSATDPDAGYWLSVATEESHKMANAQFLKASARRMGMPVHEGKEAQCT